MRTFKKGLVSKIKVLKPAPNMLIRFSLISDDTTYNCLVANELVAKRILMMPENAVFIKVNGYFNKKKQLIVTELCYQTVARNIDYYRKRA